MIKFSYFISFLKRITLIFLFFPIFSNLGSLKLELIKNPIYGPISTNFLAKLKKLFSVEIFIETGTFLGLTTENAAKVFKEVHTIELSKDIYEKTRKKLMHHRNIQFYCGDSGELLDKILSKKKEKKILFWLDGHYSGLHFDHLTAKGDDVTPIIKELECIKSYKLKNPIILIDDIRLFDLNIDLNKLPKNIIEACKGYPTTKRICSMLYSINPKFEIVILGDVLMAFDKSNKAVISDVLKACSVSRLDSNINHIMNAEKVISKAQGIERNTIERLYKWFSHFGIGNHYALWHALILISNNRKQEGYQILSNLKKDSMLSNRLMMYLKN